jgi:serine/threonine-protein kinase
LPVYLEGVPGATQLLGHSVGRYLIQSVIGSGGFATVYRAVDTALERPVALKVVDPAAHRSPTIGRRFVLEGRAVASLNHTAVVPVYDAGEHDGVLWLAMRLIEGGSLDHALTAGRRFPTDDVLAVIELIGAALDHAHSRGVVHRDVKPSNILLEANDPRRAWLTDFGIAATARSAGLYTTGALGTAAYMAPEQSRPSEVGPAADLYSLACVAYEMVADRRPFPGDDYVALLLAHATEPVPPIGHPKLDELMARALAKDPEVRPASGAALADELRAALATEATALLNESQLPPRLLAAASVPTIVDHSDDTLSYPLPPVRPTAYTAPVSRPRAAPARPDAGPAPVQRRLPPPPPPPGGVAAPPRDLTVVRSSRRRARRRLVIGVLVLAVGGSAAGAGFADLRGGGSDTKPANDRAGVRYEVPSDWQPDDQEGLVTWRRHGDVVATVSHRPADQADQEDAAAALADVTPQVCDGEPAVMSIPGATAAAVCNNPDGTDPATAIGAIVDGKFWVFRLEQTVPQSQREALLTSITFDVS